MTACSWYSGTFGELGRHLNLHLTNQESAKRSEESDSEANTDTLTDSVSIPDSGLVPVVMKTYQRNYDEALLHAYEHGREVIGLAHVDVVARASQTETSLIIPVIPTKRSANEMENKSMFCKKCAINYLVPLYKSLTTTAPYPKLIDTRNYIELSYDLCQLLNQDWTISPQMKYAAAQLLAGCILQNQLKNKVIIINTVEVYGRKRGTDIHREPFGSKKQSTIPTSLPPPTDLRYENVYPVTLNSQHGPKLVIGTQTMNYLVTSFVRLDKDDGKPSVGAATTTFKLETLEEPFATRIYIDDHALNKARKLAGNKDAKAVDHSKIFPQKSSKNQ